MLILLPSFPEIGKLEKGARETETDFDDICKKTIFTLMNVNSGSCRESSQLLNMARSSWPLKVSFLMVCSS